MNKATVVIWRSGSILPGIGSGTPRRSARLTEPVVHPLHSILTPANVGCAGRSVNSLRLCQSQL